MMKKGDKPWQGYKNEVREKLGKPKYRDLEGNCINMDEYYLTKPAKASIVTATYKKV